MEQETKTKKPYIICIVGPSGSGKDVISELIECYSGGEIQKVVSFTTRAIRDGEIDGREHFFVHSSKLRMARVMGDIVAYTEYGWCHYWTQKNQFEPGGKYVYVIDEKGVSYLKEDFGHMYDIMVVRVHCDEDIRRTRGVSKDRIVRDIPRIPIPLKEIGFHISNNGSLNELEESVVAFIDYVKNKY